ncbi:hypothetical protein SAMN05421874_120141 [Nonomuraea maritima]|uniref:Uncharacterized protein n=1 Tax=Nonomuraea maritima TaxID=683260 RepID=A0A1G9JMX7_9ACTN|nr:hypothetical protein [Nonomuraea maritima]SDL38927.1 hypothetical protein SAMN05421874_120141 [Nonomuraea maritima]
MKRDHARADGSARDGSAPNAICVGGPCDRMLTRIHQDVGCVQVPSRADGPPRNVTYRITSGRLHHPSSEVPFTVLVWSGAG